jgi:DNA-binding LacI/PurR family transcriptional regulator
VYIKTNRDDVAKLAGVSTATVSRVYNNPSSVAKEKQLMVLSAAKRLGYVPDGIASALRRGNTGIIALVEKKRTENSADRFLSALYSDVIRGLKSVIDESHYRLALVSVENSDEIGLLKSGKVCDAIIAHDLRDANLLKAIKKTAIPAVCAFREEEHFLPQISLDEEEGGRLAGERFLTKGRFKPAHITGSLKQIRTCKRRYTGFCSAYGVQEVRLINGELGIRGGFNSAMELIPEIKRGQIDSIFVVNDITAVGVLQALQASGLKVPEDISLIAHDNLPIIDTLPIKLTTIDISFRKIYSTAAKRIIDHLDTGIEMDEIIKPVLAEGDSV